MDPLPHSSKTSNPMTDLKRSIFVIPSSSLEDLPKRMGHGAALDFLTAWTSQWDPRLLSALNGLPEWKKADGNSLDLEHALLVCPQVANAQLDQTLRERLELGQCVVVDSLSRSRSDLVSFLLGLVTPSLSADDPQPLLLDDFYALGYAVLQIQILARKLRYSWNIDWIMFTEQAIAAANASLAQDAAETERWLQTCFDSLSQERDRYCSQQAYLLDVVLLAPTTLGPSLERQLDMSRPSNLIACSSLLKTLQVRNPTALDRLAQRVAEKQISLIGGLEVERLHPYMSANAILRDLRNGIRSYAELAVGIPKIYSRYQPGFTASAPTWLTQFGFSGAFLAAWSGGAVPDKDQAKIRWQASDDGKSIDTVIGFVMDASSADSYIDLADMLSKQLDYHHVPTLVFAHWPGIDLQPLTDLMRAIERTPALGKFHTAESYFASTSSPYSSDSFANSAFKISIPKSVREQNELHSQIIEYEQLRVSLERLESLHYLWIQVANQSNSQSDTDSISLDTDGLRHRLDRWFDGSPASTTHASDFEDLKRQLNLGRKNLLERIQKTLRGQKASEANSQTAISHLIVNPSNHPQRLFLDDLPGEVELASCTRLIAAECDAGRSRAIVDVPPFGFVQFITRHSDGAIPTATSAAIKKPSFWSRVSGARSGIAEKDWTLSNEFMEIQIDPKRGHLRSLYIANKRGSRLSGMTSLVGGGSDVQRKWNEEDCLDLLDVSLRIVRSSALVGTIEVTGSGKQADGRIARVTTRYTLWKGARWLDIEILAENLSAEETSCVWRTAWLNEGSSVAAWQHGIKGKLQSPLQSAVELIEIDDAEHRIFVAPRGLSSHRRSESRFLISQLAVDFSGRAQAKFAIGMDWPRPYETALDLCDQPWRIESASPPNTKPDSGAWLAQCSLPSVHFYFSEPEPVLAQHQIPEDQRDAMSGHQADVCLWIQETQGKSGSAKLSFFRDVGEAWKVDSQGREFDTLTVTGGQVVTNVNAHEQSRILLRWKTKEDATKADDGSSST